MVNKGETTRHRPLHSPLVPARRNCASRSSMMANSVSTCKMNRSANRTISINCRAFTARSISPIKAAELSSYDERTCQICCTLISTRSCRSFSSSGVNSFSEPGLADSGAGDIVVRLSAEAATRGVDADVPGVMSSRDIAEERAE